MNSINKILLAAISILFVGCNPPTAESSKPDAIDSSSIYGAQTLLWYQTLKALRVKNGKSRELDIMVLRNYFPLYLYEQKCNSRNQFIFSFVSSVYRDYNERELDDEIYNISENSFDAMNSTGAFNSFGFDEADLEDYVKFRKSRSEYLDAMASSIKMVTPSFREFKSN